MPFPSYIHLVFEMLAYFIGFRFFLRIRKNQVDPITENHRVWIFLGACAGALLGSRFLGALEDPAAWRASANPLLYLYASKTMVGGLLGGLAGVETTKKILGEKRSSGDLFTYPLILGIMIGRVGCFLSGVNEPTFGYVTSAWTGMNLGDGLKRHPIALYEIFFLFFLWLVLRWYDKNRPLPEGFRFQYFMIAYLLFRWTMEWIKPHTVLAAGQSAIQWACILGLIYYRKTLLKIIFIPSQERTHAR